MFKEVKRQIVFFVIMISLFDLIFSLTNSHLLKIKKKFTLDQDSLNKLKVNLNNTNKSDKIDKTANTKLPKDPRERKLFLRKKTYDKQFFGSTSKSEEPEKENRIKNNRKGEMKRDSNLNNTIPYDYYDYEDIIAEFDNLSQTYPNYVQITTAQEEFGLPYPAGDCNGPCKTLIVYLGNKEKFTKETPQIFVSCGVHGNERVGPTLCTEFVKLLVEHQHRESWLKYLLDNRRIILLPMSNAQGYFYNEREEKIPDQNSPYNATDNNYTLSIDPNRDFPILRPDNECFLSVTARAINEIFIRNLIRISLSIHGGTSSVTYAYGTPNHLTSIPNNEKFLTDLTDDSKQRLLERYYMGRYDDSEDYSTNEAPDQRVLENFGQAITIFSNKLPNFRYPIGKMNEVVYPVRGGFEDWAYSGSWEGSPIITNQCSPTTYGGYRASRSNYKNLNQAVKAVSFLLETSDSKFPPNDTLGKNYKDCLLGIIKTPFKYDNIDNDFQNLCLGNTMNGYISKNIRLMLILTDLAQPYIVVNAYQYEGSRINQSNQLTLKWTVGGCFSVDNTFLLYTIDKHNFEFFRNEMKKHISSNFNDFNYDTYPFFMKSELKSGFGIWTKKQSTSKEILDGIGDNTGIDSNFTEFIENIEIGTGIKEIYYIVLAQVDKDLRSQSSPEPGVHPQTHLINERTNASYNVTNAEYVIKGKKYFSSGVKVANVEYE